MHRLILIVGALAAAGTILPAGALATWYNAGTYEPDTLRDQQDGFMHLDPDVSPDASGLVYFNAYPTEVDTSTNPNVGTIGSRILVPGERQYFATLGVWKDCNADGYIGILESAAWSYSTALLEDGSICPAGSRHNDGQWVHEYFAIGPAPTGGQTPWEINDTESDVWGDFGLPGAGNSGTCPIYPLPHGTTSGTGAAIRYADCFVGKQGTRNVNNLDSTGLLAFDDPNNPQRSDSLLNQHLPVSLFGNPTTCEGGIMQKDDREPRSNSECTESPPPAFTTYDCTDETTTDIMSPVGPIDPVVIPDPTGEIAENGITVRPTDENGRMASVTNPSPSTSVNPTGSYAKALNNTAAGATSCGNTNTYSGAHNTAQFFLDAEHEGTTQNPQRVQNDVFFNYFTGLSVSQLTGGDTDELVGPNVPSSLGLNAGHQLLEGHWQAGVVYVTPPQSIDRRTLAPAPAFYATFYAKIGPQTMSLGFTGVGNGVYGSEVCGTDFTTDANPGDGWNCDAAAWAGTPVGTPYQFRDIDCDDGTLARGSGVRASLVDLTGTFCQDAA